MLLRILFTLSSVLMLAHSYDDNKPKSILKPPYFHEIITTVSFIPNIPPDLLRQDGYQSPYDFCVQHKGDSFYTFSHEITQEIVFGNLMVYAKEATKLSYNDLDVISPPLTYSSYLDFYQPLATLLLSGFRINHPSHDLLIDNCLHSLTFFQSIWRRNLPPSSNLSLAAIPIGQRFSMLASLDILADGLANEKDMDSISFSTVQFSETRPDVSIIPKAPEQHNTNRKIDIEINKALRKRAVFALKQEKKYPLPKNMIIDAMEIWDDYKYLLELLACNLGIEGNIKNEILEIIKHTPNLLSLPEGVRTSYPHVDTETESYLAIDLMHQLSFFVISFIEQNDIPFNLGGAVISMDYFKVLLSRAHHRSFKKTTVPTKQGLFQELHHLYYLFRFALSTLDQAIITEEEIMEEMGNWECSFDTAIAMLQPEPSDIEIFNIDLFGKISDLIFQLVNPHSSILLDSEYSTDDASISEGEPDHNRKKRPHEDGEDDDLPKSKRFSFLESILNHD
ncbi:MAG: hypothetical protein KF798_04605 [Candidatus Paracaedibacteraceae bacterium]|nr:hypothetical protein [Candidatus Paracaedibacteraceae bacterium]